MNEPPLNRKRNNRAYPSLLVVSILFLPLFGFNFISQPACDGEQFINEYSNGLQYSTYLNYNDRPYFIFQSQDRVFAVDCGSASIVLEPELNKQLISAYILKTNKELARYLDAYQTIKECHKVAVYARDLDSIVKPINKLIAALTSPVAKIVENKLPDIASTLAPYGWEVETKKTSQVVVRYSIMGAEKIARQSWVLDLAEYSTDSIADSPVAKIYDYSQLAENDVSAMQNGNFYSNSIDVGNALTKNLAHYLSPEISGGSLLESFNNLFAGLLNEKCRDLWNKNGNTYSALQEAIILYDKVPTEADSYSISSLLWLGNLSSSASESINTASQDMDRLGFMFRLKIWVKGVIYGYDTSEVDGKARNAEDFYNAAKDRHNKGLFISAKQYAEQANTLKNEVLLFDSSMKMQRFKNIFRR